MPIFKNVENDRNTKELLVRCSCRDIEHLINFSYYQNSYPELDVEFKIDSFERFWKRVKIAREYLFSKKRFSTAYLILEKKEVQEIVNYLQEFLKDSENYIDKPLEEHDHILKNIFLKILNRVVQVIEGILYRIEDWIDRKKIYVKK